MLSHSILYCLPHFTIINRKRLNEVIIVLVGEFEAIDACEKLIDLHAWPAGRVDFNGWLQNFNQSERVYAAHMLSHFMFFSNSVVDALFLSAFQSLSNIVNQGWRDRLKANFSWNNFLNRSYITFVQGETPNPTDSGYLFARKARQVLGMPEEQILSPDDVLKAVIDGFDGPIIFVDDFVGSGEQFVRTWKRKRYVPGHGFIAFRDLELKSGQMIAYCNAILTEKGRARITRCCPTVLLTSGNIITDAYNWTSENSILWPKNERAKGISFLRDVSQKIGLIDDRGGKKDWRGFDKLGLGIAFEHSTPDATLPLFHWTDGWCPLVRRS